ESPLAATGPQRTRRRTVGAGVVGLAAGRSGPHAVGHEHLL
ncbi:hypothetical protein, partial [Pseudomonas fluorescens]